MTACIAFQLLVASLQLHKWKLITVSSFAENFGSGFKKRKKTSSNIFLYTCEMKDEHWTGRSLRCTKQNETFLETFFDISFFPHLTKYNSNMNLARKFKWILCEKNTHVFVLVFCAKIQIFRDVANWNFLSDFLNKKHCEADFFITKKVKITCPLAKSHLFHFVSIDGN